MKINVKTGYGYISNQYGIVVSKAVLPIGEHEINDGYSYTDVQSEDELSSITVLADASPSYFTSKEFAKDNFSYDRAMEDLNTAFWDEMSNAQVLQVTSLIDLWCRWKNFTAVQMMGRQWVASGVLTEHHYDMLSGVFMNQGISLTDWGY